MITIEEIKEKAKKGYMKYLSALVAGKAFEPIEIPFSKKVSDDFATFENEQTLLLRHSKLKTGYGYAIE